MKETEELKNPFYLDLTDWMEWMICQGVYPNVIHKYMAGDSKENAIKQINEINNFAKSHKGHFPVIIQDTPHSIKIIPRTTLKLRLLERLRVLFTGYLEKK